MNHTFTDRVMLQEDGVYRWRCATEVKYEREGLKKGMIACIIIDICIILFGLLLTGKAGGWEFMLIIVGCAAVFLVICLIVFGLSSLAVKDPKQVYEMTEEFIRSGIGKSSVFLMFSGVRKVNVCEKYLEIKGKVTKMRVYIPADDMAFVRSFILTRVDPTAEIAYDGFM